MACRVGSFTQPSVRSDSKCVRSVARQFRAVRSASVAVYSIITTLFHRSCSDQDASCIHRSRTRSRVLWWACLSVCLFACLFVCKHTPSNRTPKFHTIFSLHVIRARGWVLVWQRCDTLTISGFVDDVMFARNDQAYILRVARGQRRLPTSAHVQIDLSVGRAELGLWERDMISMIASTCSPKLCAALMLTARF